MGRGGESWSGGAARASPGGAPAAPPPPCAAPGGRPGGGPPRPVRDPQLPQVLPASQLVTAADPLARPGPRQPLEPVAAHPGARRQIGEVGIRATALAFVDKHPRLLGAQAGYVTQP